MRISTGFQYDMFLGELDRTTSDYTDAQNVVATGKRISQISDDPVGAVSAVNMGALKSQLVQYASNLGTAKDWLTFTDNALSQTNNLLNSAYTIALTGANATNDANARQGMVQQLNDIESSIIAQANAQGPNGQYLFAGQKTDTQPFSATSGKISYAGDAGSISVETGPADQMVVNTQGKALYTGIYNQIEKLKTDLQSGNTNNISNHDIADLKQSMADLNNIRGTIGAQLQTVSNLTTDNTSRQEEFTKSISNVTDADMAQAMVNLAQAQNAYQAALTTIGQAHKFSLLDYI